MPHNRRSRIAALLQPLLRQVGVRSVDGHPRAHLHLRPLPVPLQRLLQRLQIQVQGQALEAAALDVAWADAEAFQRLVQGQQRLARLLVLCQRLEALPEAPAALQFALIGLDHALAHVEAQTPSWPADPSLEIRLRGEAP